MITEIRRRLFHMISGIIIVVLIYLDIINYETAFILFVLMLALGIVMKKFKIPIVYWFFEKLDRPKDFKFLPGKGAVLYAFSVFLVLYFFSKDIAMASIVILAVGDSIAPIIGQYGDIKNPINPRKYIEGSVGGAVLAGLAAALFVSPLEAGLAAVAAMIAEGIEWKIGVNQVDDNLVMPLVAAIVIWLLRI